MLKKFSDAQKIAFPLLSDSGSKTIEAYGILNKDTEGLPHPGTFILNKQGIIRARLFNEGYRNRHTTDELVGAAKAF